MNSLITPVNAAFFTTHRMPLYSSETPSKRFYEKGEQEFETELKEASQRLLEGHRGYVEGQNGIFVRKEEGNDDIRFNKCSGELSDRSSKIKDRALG